MLENRELAFHTVLQRNMCRNYSAALHHHCVFVNKGHGSTPNFVATITNLTKITYSLIAQPQPRL